jgi:hypothetical protein
MLPFDGDLDVAAEGACKDGGRETGGQLEQRGGPVPGGMDSDLLEPAGEAGWPDRPAGAPAGGRPA